MNKVGVEKQPLGPGRDGRDPFGNMSVNQGGWVQPSAPVMDDNQPPVSRQPQPPPHQPAFLPMPEPGPIYEPPPGNAPQSGFLPMPEPEPVRRTPAIQHRPQFQPQAPWYDQSTTTTPGREAPPGYYESQLAQDPIHKFRSNIFTSMDRLLHLKSLVLERESHLNEFQRRSELSGTFVGDYQVVLALVQELNALEANIKIAQQHLKESGERETMIAGTNKKKNKIHIDGCGCCAADSHFYRDLCDTKPKIHVEGMCLSPDVFAQTCEEQNKHTGWIWGHQKIAVEGMWSSPKIHLKGLLINPKIHVEGMWSSPEIHLEGICLRPEIRIEGIGAHPKIRITGICKHLKFTAEGLCCRANINIIGVCEQIEASTGGAHLTVTGVCKNLKTSFSSFSQSIKFKGNDINIRLWSNVFWSKSSSN